MKQHTMRGYLDAAHVISKVREYGGVVLRVRRNDRWHLHIWRGAKVPTSLKFRVLELEPFVLVLLRRLVAERATKNPSLR